MDNKIIFLGIVVILACLLYVHYDDGGSIISTIGENKSPLSLKHSFEELMIGDHSFAYGQRNFDVDTGMINLIIDAERVVNSTHTSFLIKIYDEDSDEIVVFEEGYEGDLATPAEPFELDVEMLSQLNYLSGFSQSTDIMTSEVITDATVFKSSKGVKYSPVVLKNGKPLVYVTDEDNRDIGSLLGSSDITWERSEYESVVRLQHRELITFKLDWVGIDQMKSLDKADVSVKFSNVKDGVDTVTIRFVKSEVL